MKADMAVKTDQACICAYSHICSNSSLQPETSVMRDPIAPPDLPATRAGAIVEAGLASSALRPQVKAFFDEATFTVSYVVRDAGSKACAIIDSVLDYDPASGRTSHGSADAVIAFVREEGLDVVWQLETHAHADHLSAAPYLQAALGGRLAIGAKIVRVQETFGQLFNAGSDFARDGRQFDHLFADGEEFSIGSLKAVALHVPGHTPACMAYVIGDAIFVGDTLFMPDYGTARCDFPGGDAATLYRSIQRLLALPEATRVFLCHDYKAPERAEFAWETTIGDQKRDNVHVHAGVSEVAFVALREARDKTLGMPRLILPSVQVNMRGGHLPEPEDNGVRYLKIPLNAV
jgi:glyoxylase-like metal-dependent hydrolase (beta-lactamase superfamily II)